MLKKIIAFFAKKMLLLMLMDAALLPLAMLSSVYLRLGGAWDAHLNPYWWIFILPVLWVIPIFAKLGLYKAALKYVDDHIVWTILGGVSLAVFILFAVVIVVGITPFPRSAMLIFWVFAMAYIGGVRFILRGFLRRIDGGGMPVLIYGAGGAGLQLMSALQTAQEYQPVAFLDDNPVLWGTTYRGLRVFKPDEADQLLRKTGAKAILLAMPSVSRSRHREILEKLSTLHVAVKRLPGMADLVSGHVRVEELKEIDIDDLLGRDSIDPEPSLLSANILNKVVMVTGAGGSIGGELCCHIARLQPKKIVLLELSEYALYTINQKLSQLVPDVPRVAVLGSVTDFEAMRALVSSHGVQTIYHAAAYKHVPIVEHNPLVGVLNNALGTDVMARAAIAGRVETFVLISTDKAVRPTSVMGATKRLAEMLLQAKQASHIGVHFVMVRFGNVLGSSGSVVPLFKQQIMRGGPITVTHPDITRYFMTLSEAVQLVIQAGAMGEGGDVFVLDMGEPIRIVDLAKRMIDLSGLRLHHADYPAGDKGDIEICFTGLRPGEKLHEELLIGNNTSPTQHPRILRAKERFLPSSELDALWGLMIAACQQGNDKMVLQYLHELVPEFQSPSIV